MSTRLLATLMTLGLLITSAGCPVGLGRGPDPLDDDDASGDDDDATGDDDDSTGDDDDSTGDDDDSTGDDDDATGDDDDSTGDDDDATGDDDDSTGDDDDSTGDDDDSTVGDDDDSTGSSNACTALTTFTASTGTFDDGSGFGVDYDNSLVCGWLIDVDASLYVEIELAFTAFAIESGYDYVNVYDGADASAPLLEALTGTSLPGNVISTGTQMYIELVTDSTVAADGFEASWTANTSTTVGTGCSGNTTLTGASGSFDDGSGPGVDYDNSSQCGWLIDTDATLYDSVTLSFSLFDVEATYDFVNVYDGVDANAPLLMALTGTTLPADITSSGAQLFVELVTDGIVSADGFEAAWVANPIGVNPPTCTGTTTLTGATGTFDDGSGAGDYSDDLSCGWLIDVDASLYADATLSFSAFDVDPTDTVNVYDGPDASAPLLVALTGTSLPADITSTGPQLFIELVTDSSTTAAGFDASYSANAIVVIPPTCSGTTTLAGGTGSFDDGSGAGVDYDNSLTCGWLIDVDATLYADITLSFGLFALENNYDYVNVYDGANASAPLLVALTGTALPANITSTGTQLFVELVTDSIISADGFEASWVGNAIVIPPTCAGTTALTTATGTFDDGSGAGVDYDNSLQCGWLIDVDPTTYSTVTLSFSSFDLENSYDYVNVYDGADANAPLLFALTGTSLPANITSSSNQLYVELVTDSIVTAGGFSAGWTANLPPPTCSGTTTYLAGSGSFDDGSGSGSNYDNNLSCGWLIDVDPSIYADVTLSFASFAVENTYDYVYVYDGGDAGAPLITALTGTSVPSPITSTGNQLFVEFVTDNIVTQAGFSASWSGNPLPTGCSGATTLTGASGTFTDGPGNYAANTSCSWLIAPAGVEAVTISFSAFSTEANYDFVTVYGGTSTSAPILGQWSGSVDLNVVLAAGLGPVLVEFTSDVIINDAGFTASYTTYGVSDECSGDVVLTDPVGALSDGAGDYANNSLCSWSIAVPEASGIDLTFGVLQTESNYDYLDVFNGADDSAALLASYDGNYSVPLTVSSTVPQMFVQLDTDFVVTEAGFTATYEAVYVPCSGTQTVTALSGAFGDGSGLDGDYDLNQTCAWLISGPSGSNIQVTAVYWDTEQTFDTLHVHDGSSGAAPLLVSWSGTGSNDSVTTSGSSAYVDFDSDFSITAPGFWVEYVVIP